jgi:hypothetical protein
VQQIQRLRHVAHVRGRGDHAVHQARLVVHADVALHPEVPLLARLVHLGVARVALVIGRTRRRNDGRIHDRARTHEQALLAQVIVDLLEQGARQVVVVEQASKLQQRRRVGHRLARQIDAHEVAQRLAVVQRIFQRLVGQPVPLLLRWTRRHPRATLSIPPQHWRSSCKSTF